MYARQLITHVFGGALSVMLAGNDGLRPTNMHEVHIGFSRKSVTWNSLPTRVRGFWTPWQCAQGNGEASAKKASKTKFPPQLRTECLG